MRIFIKNFLLASALASSVLVASASNAEEKKAPEASATKDIDANSLFCDALYKEETYKKGKYQSYKMLIPGDDGWIFRTTRDLGTDFEIKDSAKRYIKRIQDAFAERGYTFVMLYVPTRGLIHSDHISDENLKKYNFTDIDKMWGVYHDAVSSAKSYGINVVGLPKLPKGTDFFYKRDHHWNQAGAKMAAEALAAYVKTLPVYEGLSKTEYKTREVDPFEFTGTSDKVFEQICKTEQPSEKITRLSTEAVDLAQNSDDLFGDVQEPEVVLVGTSNSTIEPSFSNFEGFLKESLSTDILNMAISGGGIDSAMQAYLNTNHYKNKKGKVIIWEVPGYYDLNKHFGMFRQVLPAINNDCGDKALSSDKVKLNGTSTIVLDNLESHNVTGSNYYAYLKFEEPVKEHFTMDVRYVKNRDKYKLRRSKRYPHDNEFYLNFKDSKREALEKIVLEVPKSMVGLSLEAKLCKMD